MTSFLLEKEPTIQKLQTYLAEQTLFSFSDVKGHSFDFYNEANNKVLKFGLPLSFAVPVENESFASYLNRQKGNETPQKGLLILIQAGEAAIGVFTANNIEQYKVIRKYMVRKKQGKAQVLHLKTKGKSRAGSRIRLSQTISFFEEINEQLSNYINDFGADLIVYGISPALKSLWYNSSVKIPFDNDDFRLRKANWTIGLPRKETLEKGLWHIYSARISIFDEQYTREIKSLLEHEL